MSAFSGAAGAALLKELEDAESREGRDGWPGRLTPPEFAALQLSAQAGMQGVVLGATTGVALLVAAPWLFRRAWPRVAPVFKQSRFVPARMRDRIHIVPKLPELMAFEEAKVAAENAKAIATSKWAAVRLNIEHIGGSDGLKAAAEAAQSEAERLKGVAAVAQQALAETLAAAKAVERASRKEGWKRRWVMTSGKALLRAIIGGILGSVLGSVRALDDRLWPVITLAPSKLGDECRLVYREGFAPGSTLLFASSDDVDAAHVGDDGGTGVAAESPFFRRVLQVARSSTDADEGRSFFYRAASSLPVGPYDIIREGVREAARGNTRHKKPPRSHVYKF